MDANNLTYNSSNGNGLKTVSLSFFSKIFNIAPPQWPRVSECWLITFFFKVGSAIGWTVLTAAFVGRFGITFLPTLFVINAVLIILSTFFFERLIMRIKREVLMILMILIAAIGLFFASFLYDRSPFAFFTLIILSESIFLAQFNVFIPILVGDRFTPLESQRTFPFIESADSIGGMIGGGLVGIFAQRFPINWFLYFWIACLACIIFVFIITSFVRIALPPLPFRISSSTNRESKDQIKRVFRSIKIMPFLKGLIAIVLLQWVFMNFLEFQYTKAIQQTITRTPEQTVVKIDSHLFQTAVLSSPDGVKNISTLNPESHGRSMSVAQQTLLAQKLGQLKGIFHAGALLIQVLFASRLITSLGIVGSLLLHPVIMLMSLVGMFLKFGFVSSVITKMNFEVTNVIHKNAYFASHYAMPKSIRDQAAEFLEGIVRPMGTIISMLFILGLQFAFSGRDLTLWIHLVMFCIMALILIATIRLQPKYTKITKDQLFSNLPYPEKLNAIEILAQKGHKNAPFILIQKLNDIASGTSQEPLLIRMRLLSALGQSKDYNVLPEILDALYDPNPDVRLEAAHALMNFHRIGEQFYAQAFSRFRMIESLKEVFRHEKSAAVRNAIIRVFSLIHEPAIVSFLLEVLHEPSSEIRADCIYTLGLFHDPNTAYYIVPYLKDPDPVIKAKAVVALWQFSKYREQLEQEIKNMLASSHTSEIKAAIFVIGELGLPWKQELFTHMQSADESLQLEAAYALTKSADPHGFAVLLQNILYLPNENFEVIRRFLSRLKPKAKTMVESLLVNFIAHQLHNLAQQYRGKSLAEIDRAVLEQLRRLYTLVDEHEELFAIEQAQTSVLTPQKTLV